MSTALVLIALAVCIGLSAPAVLQRASWSKRSPRLGIAAWQASVFAVLSSGVLLAVTAILPVRHVSFDLGHVLHACPDPAHPAQLLDDAPLHLLSLAMAVATLLVLGRALYGCCRSVRRGRQRQRQLLDLLVRQRDELHGAHVLEHDVPLAYCVPGAGGGQIVVTTAALASLDERELTAVLAHEHAHLDGRHDLILLGADVAARAFPWLPLARTARRELALLVEMLADDEGARRTDRDTLARALIDLGQAAVPVGAVAANGDTVERVHRLLAGLAAPGRLARCALAVGTTALLISPWLVALLPPWAAHSGLCSR